MSGQDAEIQHLKASVSCAVLLERLPPVWRLDRAESTRRCLKYRRGAGEIVIVNHDGRGWWDPLSEAKGDVFSLAQHLEPSLNFAQARLCCAASWGSRQRSRRPSASAGRGCRACLSPGGGPGASPCHGDLRLGSISPRSGDCRRVSGFHAQTLEIFDALDLSGSR